MRIVLTAHGFPPKGVGGTECYVKRLAKQLRDNNHQVFVYAGSPEWREQFSSETQMQDGYELTRVHRNDLYFDQWDKAYNPLVEEHFRAYLRERKPDLVHAHHWIRLTTNLCSIAGGLKIPSMATLHDFYTACPRIFRVTNNGLICKDAQPDCLTCADRRLFQQDPEIKVALKAFFEQFLDELQCASFVLTPSKSHGHAIKKYLDLETLHLPLGSLHELKPAPRNDPKNKPRIVFFSQLYPHKGPDLLIQAFKEMEQNQKAELHLFGEEVIPEFANHLKSLAQGLNVTFHGPYHPKDLEAFPMDLIVIPSQAEESYSYILDEAAKLQVPVLAAEGGALPERSKGSVRFFQRDSVKELCSGLNSLIFDPTLLEKMRSAEPITTVSMKEHAHQLEKLYQKAEIKDPGPNKTFERLKEQWLRREINFRELVRIEEWEDLAASLRKRIADLEKEL